MHPDDADYRKQIQSKWDLLKDAAGPLPRKPKFSAIPRDAQASFFDRPEAPLTIRGLSTRQSEGEAGTSTGTADCVPFCAVGSDGKPLWKGGEDRAEIVLYVKWNDWGATRATFERARENAAAADVGGEGQLIDNVIRGDWIVEGSGFRIGDGGPMLRYAMGGEGMRLGIMNREEYSGTMPNVKLVIGSAVLMERGFQWCWEYLCEWLTGWNATIDKAIVSRIDYCVDTVNVPVADFVTKFMQRHWVSRSRRFCAFSAGQPADETTAEFHGQGMKFTGFSLGKGIRLTVYDKLLETRHDAGKHAILVNQRWGGELEPEHATRVEFQVRREYLKQFETEESAENKAARLKLEKATGVKIDPPRLGIDSPEQWIAMRGSVLEYLTGEWFRMTEELPDAKNGNQGRAVEWSTWAKVRESFCASVHRMALPIGRTQRKAVDELQLKAQARGVLASIYALSGELPPDEKNFCSVKLIAWLHEEIASSVNSIEPEQLKRSLYSRLQRDQARTPLGSE